MRIAKSLFLAAIAAASISTDRASADPVATLDFDGSFVNFSGVTNNIDPTLLPAGDMFNVGSRGALMPNGFGLPFNISDDSNIGAMGNTSFANDVLGVVGQAKTDRFFGVSDTVNGVTPDTGIVTWSWDITNVLSIDSLSIDFAAMGDFELADTFVIEVLVDGGTPITVFSFTADEAVDFSYTMDLATGDTNPDGFTRTAANPVVLNDPLIETLSGTYIGKADVATGAFTTLTYLFPRALSGSLLELRLTATTDGPEGFALDNIVFQGTFVPEPSSLVLVGLGAIGLGGLAIRRRKRA